MVLLSTKSVSERPAFSLASIASMLTAVRSDERLDGVVVVALRAAIVASAASMLASRASMPPA